MLESGIQDQSGKLSSLHFELFDYYIEDWFQLYTIDTHLLDLFVYGAQVQILTGSTVLYNQWCFFCIFWL